MFFLSGGLLIYTITLYYSIVKKYVQYAPKDDKIQVKKVSLESTETLLDSILVARADSKLKYGKSKFKLKERDIVRVLVDISEQRAFLFDKDGKYEKMYRISTGNKAENRDIGSALWKIIEKREKGLPSLYGPRLLLLARRNAKGVFVPTTIALHGTDMPNILGYPKSLGCVYFHNRDILEIYPKLEVNDYVITID